MIILSILCGVTYNWSEKGFGFLEKRYNSEERIISARQLQVSRQLRFGETGRQTQRKKGGSVDQSIK